LLLKCDVRYRAVEVLLACNTPLFLIEFAFARNLFVTAWSWYGRFIKSLVSLNLLYRASICERIAASRKFSETGLFEYQVYIELYLSRN